MVGSIVVENSYKTFGSSILKKAQIESLKINLSTNGQNENETKGSTCQNTVTQ